MRPTRLIWIAALAALALGGCTSAVPMPQNVEALAPVRFLLTFDDGPSASFSDNTTERIVDTLAHNGTQPGVKAVFFVQSRWPGAGGSTIGRQLLQRIVRDGHVLGIHSGTVRGHINHRTMRPDELLESMLDARADLRDLGAQDSRLVRPPYWAFNASTLATYDRAGLSMLLTDLRARDGNRNGWGQVDAEFGGRLHRDFRHFLLRLQRGEVPVIDGVAPVVVTFHDTNAYTAQHLPTYMATLSDVAHGAGARVADLPFYADHDELLHVARARAKNNATYADLAP